MSANHTHNPLRWCLIALLLLGYCGQVSSAKPIQVDKGIETLFIQSKHLGILSDLSNQLTIRDILRPEQQAKFISQEAVMPYLNNPDATYWIKMTFEGWALLKEHWVIENLVSQTNYLQAFYIDDDGELVTFKPTGLYQPFGTRPLFGKNFAFDLPKQEKVSFYFNVKSAFAVHGAFELKTQQAFFKQASKESALLMAFYAMLFLGLLVYALMFFQYKDVALIKYVLFGLSAMFLCTSEDNIGFQFLWCNFPQFNYWVLYFSPIVFIAALINYVKYFMEIPSKDKFFQLTLAVFWIGVLKYLIDLYFNSSQVSVPIFYATIPLLLGMSFQYRKNEKSNYIFITGLTVLSVGILAFICRRYMLLDINWSNPFLFYFLNFVLLVISIIFSISIGVKTRTATIAEMEKRKLVEIALQQKLEEVSAINIELKNNMDSNNELEQFAHTVSHDLKQPVRTVNSFSKLLEKSLKKKNQLESDQEEFLEFIISSTDNMQKLISGLLEYAKISGIKNNYNYLSTNDLFALIENNLNHQIKENNVRISYGNIPDEIYGVKLKLIQLFQNIISNAIKFRQPDKQCIIQISVMNKVNEWQFTIQDNGIGIPDNQKQKVFEIFSRAHHDKGIQGSGIGLATCQRIVAQHNGKIWVDPDFQNGTIFHFTLQKEQAKESSLNGEATIRVGNELLVEERA